MTDLSQNIKKLRKEKGWTQQELADKLFVTRQAVSNWELGKTEPDVDTLVKISQITETDIKDIVLQSSTPSKSKHIDKILLEYVILLIVFLVAKYLCIYATNISGYGGVINDSIAVRLSLAEKLRQLTLPWYAVSLSLVNFLVGAIIIRIIKPYLSESNKFIKTKQIIHIICFTVMLLHCVHYFTGWCSSAFMLSVNDLLNNISSSFLPVKRFLYNSTMLQTYRWRFIPFGALYEYCRK